MAKSKHPGKGANIRTGAEGETRHDTSPIDAQREKATRSPGILRYSADYIIELDRDHRIVYLNRTEPGIDPEAIIGTPLYELDPPERRSHIKSLLDCVVREGNQQRYDTVYRRPDGTEVCFSSVVAPIMASGKITGSVLNARDVTELRQAEDVLRDSERMFHELTENVQDVFWIGSPDWERVYYVSSAYEVIWGQSRESLYEQPRSWLNAVHPDDRAAVEAGIEAKRQGDLDDPAFPEYRVIRPDGTQCWILARAYPVHDENGQAIRIAGIAKDITERKQAEEALRAERDFAEALVNTQQSIVLVLDLQGRIVRFNPYMEELSGYRLEEVKGQDWFSTFLPERDQKRIRELFNQSVGDVQTRGNVNCIVTKGGVEREIEWYDNTLKNLDGETIGLLAVGQDITERKRLEDRFHMVVEAAPNALVMTDREGCITLVNRQTENLFGYTREELSGQSVATLVPERFRTKHSGHVTGFFSTPEARPMGAARDLFGLCKDGTEVPIEIGLNPLTTEEGAFVLASIVDITERKRMEEDLRKAYAGLEQRVLERTSELSTSEARYRRLVEGSPAVLYSFSDKRGTLYCSARVKDILGYSMEYLLEHPFLWNRSIHPEDVPGVTEVIQKAGQGVGFEVEYRIKHANGEWIWLDDRSLGTRRSGDETIIDGLAIDITARKRSEYVQQKSHERALRQRTALSRLFLDDAINSGDIQAAVRKLTEEVAAAILVERVGIWFLSEDGEEMRCIEQYESSKATHTDGAIQKTRDYPRYWEAIRTESQINADDAQNDPRTNEFNEELLIPLGITSMLDAGIQAEGTLFGVVCLEHIGEQRVWSSDEQAFVSTAAGLIAQVVVNVERQRMEKLYHSLIENSVQYFQIHQDGHIVFASQRLVEWSGFTMEELLALPPEKLQMLVHPDDREMVWGRLRDRLDGKDVPGRYECRVFRKDGSVRWTELAASLIEFRGKPAVQAGFIDITDRKLAENDLRSALEEIRQLKDKVEAENVILREHVRSVRGHVGILGQSSAILEVLAQARQVAETDSTVLILGETGTGKELLAEAIHEWSARRDRPFVRIACSAIPGTLVESELFGREKGAYTGALSKQIGRFEAADGGTLFLDEIGELPVEIQVKLLRVLQEGKFERLGASKTIQVNVRIIAATNRDLEEAIREGSFRSDLFYRLNVFPVTVPSLRERLDDIPELVWGFVKEFSQRMGKIVDSISPDVMNLLQQHPWPGNIRELRNVIERAMILSADRELRVHLPQVTPVLAAGKGTLEEVELQHILKVLEQTGWRIRGKNGAAARLGLKPTTLESRMARLGIERPHR